MSATWDVEEVNGVNEVKDGTGRVAAFFDLDGTLVGLPSLERRFFRILRYRKLISPKNYFFWLREAVRLMPRGIKPILHANKMYLRGVQVIDGCGRGGRDVSSWHKDGREAAGQASAPPRCYPRLPVPAFFAQAIETAVWHAKQGHEIVLLSGTLEPLAREAACALEARLAGLGIAVAIRAIATRLEKQDGRWTGRISGDAVFGEAKARAAKQLAAEMRLDLQRCYAYGDSSNDRWLMALVGRPAAVNPSKGLASIARTRGWPILLWEKKENIAQRRPDPVGAGAAPTAIAEKERRRAVNRRMQVLRAGNSG